MPTDKEKIKHDFCVRKKMCMTTVKACKKLIAISDELSETVALAFIAGLDELEKVIEDYFGIS